MDDEQGRTSEDELLRLRAEGKISDEEYEKLLAVMQDQPVERPPRARGPEPEFIAFRRRLLRYSQVVCLIGLPLGLLLKLPDPVRVYVCGLSIVGIIFSSIKLRRMRENS